MMRKADMIKEIIEKQTKLKKIGVFVDVAKKNNLERLNKSELTIVYNVTYIAYSQFEQELKNI